MNEEKTSMSEKQKADANQKSKKKIVEISVTLPLEFDGDTDDAYIDDIAHRIGITLTRSIDEEAGRRGVHGATVDYTVKDGGNSDFPSKLCGKCRYYREDRCENGHAPCEFYGLMVSPHDSCGRFELGGQEE